LASVSADQRWRKWTEGNPFFMEEVVQTLVEEKSLLGEPGRFRIEHTPAALHIPTTVQGVLAARIDRLPVAEKELLQARLHGKPGHLPVDLPLQYARRRDRPHQPAGSPGRADYGCRHPQSRQRNQLQLVADA
jgi:hypothetical protein